MKKKKKIEAWNPEYKKLKTADGVQLKNLSWADPLYEVKKDGNNIFRITKIVFLSIVRQEDFNVDELQNIWADKALAEDQAFKFNKLRFESQYPKKSDYRENYKKALRILATFTDEQLFEFVELNYRNDGTGI